MSESATPSLPVLVPLIEAEVKQLDASKVRRRPGFDDAPVLRKPGWIRVSIPGGNAVATLKSKLRENHLVTVCEDAGCPNLHECGNAGTATFMIVGDICTRRCSRCQVASGRPKPPDARGPDNLARTVADLGLRCVVIACVDRDDLSQRQRPAFLRLHPPHPCVVADDQDRDPDPRLQGQDGCRAGGTGHRATGCVPPQSGNRARAASQRASRRRLRLVAAVAAKIKDQHLELPTKSGIVLGLGETREQVEDTLRDLRDHSVNMITIGQNLRPPPADHPVIHCWAPEELVQVQAFGMGLGFACVASDPMTRSSSHANRMAAAAGYVTLDTLKRAQRSLAHPN